MGSPEPFNGDHSRERRRWSMASFVLSCLCIVVWVGVGVYAALNQQGANLVASILITAIATWVAHSSWRSYRAHQ